MAALWLQDKLKSESEEGDMVGRSAIVTVGKFLSSDKILRFEELVVKWVPGSANLALPALW